MTAPPGRPPRVGVLTTDTGLLVRSWDPTLAAMTGIASEQAIGRPLGAVIPDLSSRLSPDILSEPLATGVVRILASAFHQYLIPCPPSEPSSEFDHMEQRVVIGALRNADEAIVGLMITIEDVTRRVERERQAARALREGTAAERSAAVRELAALDTPDARVPVEAALADDDWQVRRTAVRALADRPHASLVDTVVQALTDGHHNFSLLSSALQLLSTTGLDVTDALISLMSNPDPDLRIQVALALGMQNTPEAAHALVGAFDDPDVNVRFHAIEAIGRDPHPDAAGRLLQLAMSGDFFLAFPAIEALVRIGDPLAAPLLSPLLVDGMLGGVTAEALGQMGDESSVEPLAAALDVPAVAVQPIVDALAAIHRRHAFRFHDAAVIESLVAEAMTPPRTRRIVAELSKATGAALKPVITVLGWIRNETVPAALAAHLGSADARHEVVEALVRMGGPAVTHLLGALQAGDEETRRAAVVALGRMGDRRATPALIAVLEEEGDRALWVAAAGALARLGDRDGFECLLARLGDRDAAVRHAAIGALNSIGHPDMSRRVAEMIADPSPLIRESAIRIAGYFGYADCADRAFASCADVEETVRAAAIEHLPYYDDPRALDRLRQALAGGSPLERAAAARALGAMPGAHERDLLVGALADDDSWVRYFAAIALGRHGDAAALDPLARRARGDTAMQVSVAAIEAIAALETEAGVATLTELAGDDGPRGLAAIRALGRWPSGRGIVALRTAARQAEPSRRLAAVEALAADGSPDAVEMLKWIAAADSEPDVATAAIAGLRAVANRRAPSCGPAVAALLATLAERSRRDEVLAALATLERDAVPLLADAMSTADTTLRRGVADALSRLSHPAATARLLLALSDEDAQVRRTSILGLSRVGARGLATRLSLIAQSDPAPLVQRAALAALRRQGDGSASENA